MESSSVYFHILLRVVLLDSNASYYRTGEEMKRTMTTDDLLALLPNGKPLELVSCSHQAVIMPQVDKSFLHPQLTIVQESEIPLPPIIIISAPGAVGKTALAQYIGARKNCFFWDLSKLKLGDNSFVGTIAQCFGAANLVAVLTALQEGNMCFIIDAFDEAEILSGWPMVEGLLDEVCNCANVSSCPSFVLLARSDTASLLRFYLDEKESIKKLYLMLEIDYFDHEKSKAFISLQVAKIARDTDDSSLAKRHVQHSVPFLEAIDSIFDSIYKAFSLDAESAWRSRILCSFLGYAPVLQAISAYLSSFSNFQEVQTRIGEGLLSVEGAKIASSIMDDLLLREQDKVISALKNKNIPESKDWTNWESIYTPQEQLQRIMLYVFKDSRATTVGFTSQTIPGWLAEHYSQCLSSLFPQHPFLRGHIFTGPAFRDYSLAFLLKESEEFRAKSRLFMEMPQYVATPLLIQFYRTDGTDLVSSCDIDFLYESYMSRDTAFELRSVMIVVSPDDAQSLLHRIEFYDEPSINNDYIEPITLYVRKETPLTFHFRRRLRNAFLEIEGRVVLGTESGEFEAADLEIACDEIEFRSKLFIVHSAAEGQSVRIVAGRYIQISPSIAVKHRGPGILEISWPGGTQYPWSQYSADDAAQLADVGIVDAFLGLRRILTWFRRDRRHDFARHVDLINNVAVGDHVLRQRLLQYLLDRHVIYEVTPLYILDENVATGSGINWEDIRRGRITDQIRGFLEPFIQG